MANLVSTRPIFVVVAATRRSQAKAISSPPPKATPSRATITGMGRFSRSEMHARALVTNGPTSSGFIFARSFRSAPAQNTPGTKERMPARQGSCLAYEHLMGHLSRPQQRILAAINNNDNIKII
ncbi:hypothetical protein E2C01_035640 [Portunus trituberculatus]|uniref:Uncharacterized protein n=1 Tax=Portunus trituberculatus TaxID=210409 RepID=A0A5B7F9Q0_PORTR|nr:hypothetical protein [Portunus trituberculatus]